MRSSIPRAAAALSLLGALLVPLLPTHAATAAVPHAASAPGAELGYDRLTIRRGEAWLAITVPTR